MENIISQLQPKQDEPVRQQEDFKSKFESLEDDILKDKEELTTQYLILMRERNVYFEKLKMIQTYAEEQNWEDDQQVLQQIKNLLLNYGK